jgi:acetyl esterase/lipase
MKKTALQLILIFLIFLASCSQKLTSIQDLSTEQKTSTYKVLKDVTYGEDAEQNMDIYLSQKAKSLGKRNYTIVFIHGGGFYLSDKTKEERYIEPYLKKGMNVVNLNYRLKRGIPLATSDLTHALNFLKANNNENDLNLKNIIVTGFSAGGLMASNVGVAQNNPHFPDKLNGGIKITGIINFSGGMDGLGLAERIFSEHENELYRSVGKALFPAEDYETKENLAIYEPITYFDQSDPPVFIWYGGLDDQVPPVQYKTFESMRRKGKDVILYIPNGKHSPNKEEFENAYVEIFRFLDR